MKFRARLTGFLYIQCGPLRAMERAILMAHPMKPAPFAISGPTPMKYFVERKPREGCSSYPPSIFSVAYRCRSRSNVGTSNPDVMLVRMALKQANVECVLHVAQDGQAAIELVERFDTDLTSGAIGLLLRGLNLPKRNGEEILKRLRSTERNAQVPVLVLSASDAPRNYERTQKYAAMHYFRKPCSLEEYMNLGTVVRDPLAAHRKRNAPPSAESLSAPLRPKERRK